MTAPTPDRPDHEVVIIGAGLSGIGMGIALSRAGLLDFVILERAGDIGGTWRDNTDPGIAVDVPAQAYQFSFELNPDWSRAFAEGAEVKAYLDRVADRYRVRGHIRCHHDVTERVWDDEAHLWRLTVNGTQLTARHVVSAIGPFVDPKPVDIPGVEEFGGTVMCSSRWDHDVELAGARVAVIGTGASAVQIVPEIARRVARLDVYQRTPVWVGPKLDPSTARAMAWLFRRCPASQRVVRAVATRAIELMLIDLVVHHHRVPWLTRAAAAAMRSVWYRLQVPDAALRARLTPGYGIGCKRPTVSNSYLRSYEGISMPGLPNHFMMFGPYGWVGGTWHQLVESTSAHIVRVITEARRRGATLDDYRYSTPTSTATRPGGAT